MEREHILGSFFGFCPGVHGHFEELGMLIRVGDRNVLIVGPLKSELSMFYLSMYYMIPRDKILFEDLD